MMKFNLLKPAKIKKLTLREANRRVFRTQERYIQALETVVQRQKDLINIYEYDIKKYERILGS